MSAVAFLFSWPHFSFSQKRRPLESKPDIQRRAANLQKEKSLKRRRSSSSGEVVVLRRGHALMTNIAAAENKGNENLKAPRLDLSDEIAEIPVEPVELPPTR